MTICGRDASLSADRLLLVALKSVDDDIVLPWQKAYKPSDTFSNELI